MEQAIGKNIQRKDAWLKVSGKARYNDDGYPASCLQARLRTSEYAHARILTIDTAEAMKVPGVWAVVTGKDCNVRTGSVLKDMPLLASDVARYFGEPLAIAVADSEWQAAMAASKIRVEYEPLPVVNSPDDALQPGAALIHPDLAGYKHAVSNVYPESNTNISNRTRIRKGDMKEGWANSEIVIEGEYDIPQANHAFIETRNARAEILPGGRVNIHSASQAPHACRKQIAGDFLLNECDIVVSTLLVGGGYGGKVNAHPEMMAYIASKAVGGKEVRIALTREESFYASACKIGAKARVKLGADRTGKIQALQVDFLIDSGAYADTAPVMARAAAVSCSGIYNIPNIQCDSVCVYTNHVYTTSFRGFGHGVSTFAIERSIEKLAERLGMDSAWIRLQNAIKGGDYTPTQIRATLSNTGNAEACLLRLKELIGWEKGVCEQVGDRIIRAKGLACFSKTSSSPTDAVSSAVVTFCADGSVNLNCSVVECGPGMTTALPQILAERIRVKPDKIVMNTEINTQSHPEHWKTVASMSTYMAGNAILSAADDAIGQLKENAARALRCNAEDVEIGEECVYLKEDPSAFLSYSEVALGVKTPDGNAAGGPVIGRGRFIMKHLSILDRQTGEGRPGPYWTVGAQGVEVEYNREEHTFRLVRAVTVLDAGKVIHPGNAAGQVMGAMNTGLSLATREAYHYSPNGEPTATSFRTYKIMHFAQNPLFTAEFVETPNTGGPYGARGLAEHGILGMPPALANALCKAAGVQLDTLPITFESLWRATQNQNKSAEEK